MASLLTCPANCEINILFTEEKTIEEALLKVDDSTFRGTPSSRLHWLMLLWQCLVCVSCCLIEGCDWNIVVMETKTLASEWNQLAVFLGLPSDLINGTIKMAGSSFQCWGEALRQWIKQNYNTCAFGEPSWRTLLRAVAQVNKLQFKTLAGKHKGITSSPSRVYNKEGEYPTPL